VVADRKAPGDEQLLGEFFVHACGAGQYTRADVWHPGQLEQALDGAVLAVRSVQDGEHDVDRGEHLAALTEGQQLAAAHRVGRKCQFGARFPGDLRQPAVRDRQSVGAAVGQHPRSTGGDADRDYFEPLRVEVA
jgi:hypothetical protein